MGSAWVAFGSAVGGMVRYGLSGLIANRIGETFPWGTLVVNVTGSLVIGTFAALIAPAGALPGDVTVRQLLIVGLCGGYTTFSSFSLQTLNLARDAQWARVFGNIVASVLLCLLAVWAGFALGAFFSGG
ncbi:MAG TPA: fluoride efflux transporter CrcB [Stellaceae bacterium]|nr:fluoride efflux transporter CrcB [Stellaceae bacterium]